MVNHGHILVNDSKVNIPSYEVKTGDVITLREKYRKNDEFADNFLALKKFSLPYIEKDYDKFSGVLIKEPERDEIPIDANETLVVELYSK